MEFIKYFFRIQLKLYYYIVKYKNKILTVPSGNRVITMGRFKVYDPKKLVNILNDPNYGNCLLCEKKLKTIMGNIKRHYEQMHSVYVDANVKKIGKNKRKKSKKYEDDWNFKLNKNLKKSINANKNPTNEILKTKITATATPISTNINSSSMNNLITVLELSDSDSTDNCQSSVSATKRKKIELSSFTNLPILEIKQKEEINKPQIVSNTKIEPQLHIAENLSPEKSKPNEENEDIQIPCNSYINNIQISSLEACHKVEFFKCLVETKAQLNIPVQNFQKGETFQKALQVWKQNFQFNYSSQTIGEHIDRLAKKLRQEIIKTLNNRIIYLKLDVASNKQGNVMLVNIQFMNDFEIKVITLSALELFDDHLATYLKEKVLTVLEIYKIDISNVFSITKDNANNVKEYLQIKMESHERNIHPQCVEYCQHLCKQFPGHAIHFVACDIINLLNENICQSRDSAKSLQRKLSHLKIKDIPVLDNTTSWFSIYDMIKSLINVRKIVETNKILVEVDWIFAVKFLESFKPIVDTALMLQTDKHLTMGDFYREWLLCELEMEELSNSNELALYLLEALRKHKKDFFENASFLSAIYLDPRFCYMGSMFLNDTQKEIAIVST